ncbi:hypothetical protein [Kocuria marina]|nr:MULTISPECIES: hypothetical protein [Kocuria]MCT2021457.1 hypothetical protein [Kocuria marina]
MSYWDHRKPVHRTRAVDDLFDLGLDHALGADPAMRHAVDTYELTDLT